MKITPMMRAFAMAISLAALVQGCSTSPATQQSMAPQYSDTGAYSGADWNAALDAAMDVY